MRRLLIALFLMVSAGAASAQAVTVATRVEADKTHTMVHEVVVNAAMAQVWEAVSTAEGWKGWAAPVAWSEPDVIETSYTPTATPGDASTIRQLLTARIPGRMLAFRTVKAPERFPNFDTFRLVSNVIELERVGKRRTRVRLTAVGYPDSAAGRQLLGFFRDGNRISLERLRDRFAKGPIDWSRAK